MTDGHPLTSKYSTFQEEDAPRVQDRGLGIPDRMIQIVLCITVEPPKVNTPFESIRTLLSSANWSSP